MALWNLCLWSHRRASGEYRWGPWPARAEWLASPVRYSLWKEGNRLENSVCLARVPSWSLAIEVLCIYVLLTYYMWSFLLCLFWVQNTLDCTSVQGTLETVLMLTHFLMCPPWSSTVLGGGGGVVSKLNSWVLRYGGNSREVNRECYHSVICAEHPKGGREFLFGCLSLLSSSWPSVCCAVTVHIPRIPFLRILGFRLMI